MISASAAEICAMSFGMTVELTGLHFSLLSHSGPRAGIHWTVTLAVIPVTIWIQSYQNINFALL
jgi:hypothetical protein